MSRNKSAQSPSSSPQSGVGVDFLVRTMIEREATGKRRIRPKPVDDLLEANMDESDDPDFDLKEESSDSDHSNQSDGSSSSNSGSDDDDENKGNGDDSEESDDEDYQAKPILSSPSDDSDDESESETDGSSSEENDESTGSDSDGPEVVQKSALRETLQKVNNNETNFLAKRPTKKKRKVKPGTSKSNSKVAKKGKASAPDSKSKSKSSKAKANEKSGKTSKTNKKVISKKINKQTIMEKRKKKVRRSASPKSKRSIHSLVVDGHGVLNETRKELEVTKPICSACLGDKSDDMNEVVECDSCGISVHEACYGLNSETASISSGSGSSSCTEPWFCDVCKSGSANVYCELCPVLGGLFKESTAGRWVHLVCAMYTSGIVLHNDSSINMYELQYSKWGSHNCSACKSEKEAQTGIVISCDAGLCKTYFHATCAQKQGLLSDPNQVDFSEADPYFVSCKLHTNRESMKRRIKLFNALQEQLRIKRERKELLGLPSGVNEDHARILRKLNKVREKTAMKRAQYLNNLDDTHESPEDDRQLQLLPASWNTGNKKQRLMHTSAKSEHEFLRKMDMLGDDVVAEELAVKNEKIISNIKRKWNVLPANSVEFAAYYADRESRISTLVDKYDECVKEHQELKLKQNDEKDRWETHAVNQMAMQEETDNVSEQLESLVSVMKKFLGTDKRLFPKLNQLVRPKELAGYRRKSPSMSRGDRKSPSPRSKKSQKNRQSPSPSRPGKIIIAQCATCSKSDNQYLITRCDKCRRHYHLGCLDPPLTRLPKRSKLCGWMCSDCCETPSETDDQVDTEAPRTLRGRTKIHKPRKYRGSDDSEDDAKPQAEEDGKPVSKKSKSHSNASSSASPDMSSKLLSPADHSAQNSPNKASPSEKHKRGSQSNLPSTSFVSDANAQAINGTIAIPLMLPEPAPPAENGDLSTDIIESVMNAQLKNNASPKKPKAKKSATPKTGKTTKKQNQEEVGTIKKKVTKRKLSDGPLTTFKVNGLTETPIPNLEDGKPIVSPPQKRSKKKKDKTASIIGIAKEDAAHAVPVPSIVVNGIPVTSENSVKPKKPRKKKEPKPSGTTGSLLESPAVKIGSPKKSRKKASVPSAVDAGATQEQEPVGLKDTEKKAKKKSSLTKNAANVVPKDMVNMSMEAATSQVLLDRKLKNVTAKTTKKRKSSITTPNLNSSAAVPSVPGVIPVPEEKSMPPKKRKRVPSNLHAQQQAVGPNNSIDSIIKAVSSGDFADDPRFKNGDFDPGMFTSKLAAIMQGMAPPNQEMTSGQNIMEGKAMGSGTNSGEMVTVDTSFLIDGAVSSPSAYNQNSTATTFYSSTNYPMPGTTSEMENGVQFHIPDPSSTSSDNVLRLNYQNQEEVLPATSDQAAQPNPLRGVCAKCTKNCEKKYLNECDLCHLEYHFDCEMAIVDSKLPLMINPKKKGLPWFCEECDTWSHKMKPKTI